MASRRKSELPQHRTTSTKKTRTEEAGTTASPVEGRGAGKMATPTLQGHGATKLGARFGPPDTLFNPNEGHQFTLTDPWETIQSHDLLGRKNAFAAPPEVLHYTMPHVPHAMRQNPPSTAASSSNFSNGPVWATTQPHSGVPSATRLVFHTDPSSSLQFDPHSSYADSTINHNYVRGGWNSTPRMDEAVAPVERPGPLSTLSHRATLIYDNEGTMHTRSESPVIPHLPPPTSELRPSPPGPPLPMDQNTYHYPYPHHANQNLPDPYAQSYPHPMFYAHISEPIANGQIPVVESQIYLPPSQVHELQTHHFSSMGLQSVPGISITDTSTYDASPFTVSNAAPAETSTEEADAYWKAVFAPIRSAWEDFVASVRKLIKNGDPNKETLEPCLQNIEMNLARIPAMFTAEDRHLLQDLLDRVRPEGTEAMRELKECLGHYAGNNIESIRDAVRAILESLKTKKRFLAFYDEPPPPSSTHRAVRPSGLPTNSVLIRRRNKNEGSSQGKAADFAYKVLRCSNGNCTYCTHKTKNNGTEYWRTRQDVMTHLLSSLLGKQRNLWICPACPTGSKPFSTKEVLRHHLTIVHHIPTSRGKRHQESNTTPIEPESTHGRQASSSSTSHRRSSSGTRYNPLERPPSPNPSSRHLAPHSSTTHHRRGRSLSSCRASGDEGDTSSSSGQRINRNRNEPDLIAVPTAAIHANVDSYRHLATMIPPQSPVSLATPYLNSANEQTVPSFSESHYLSPTEENLSTMFSNSLSQPLDVQHVAHLHPSHHPLVYQYGSHSNDGNYRPDQHGKPNSTRRNEYS
ncbi:hypothetical protein CPB86DRAFT_812950 [Serendipita vermifera]|nr:hypothetical protein CPB86DRAFT_812950 [Serendipita vermifera]